METELEFRVIKLTDSALSHGRINIRACGREFFPPEAFGNSSRARGGGARLCLRIKGLTEPVMTDIPTDAAGRPRWFFRERAWVKPFIQVNSLSAGAQVLIRRLTCPSRFVRVPPEVNTGSSHQPAGGVTVSSA
jgi:hypothetical protein